jgi:hypothetical protein
MLSAETSALVAGGMRAPATAADLPVTVRVVRPVMWGGSRQEIGTEISVHRWQAADLITAGKAERIAPQAAAATPPPAPAPKAAKEKSRAEQ